jgi:protein TonB
MKVLEGIPMLNAAAMSAVARWRYTPTLLDGRPVPLIMTIIVNFRLSP